MTAHVVVWDIETVPDLLGYAAANGHHGKSDDEIREADARGRWRAHARGLVGARGRMTLVSRLGQCDLVDTGRNFRVSGQPFEKR